MQRFGVLCLLLLGFLTGCADDRAPRIEPRTVTDDLGRTVELPDSVERVLTLAPNLTEIVFAAGAGHKLVGATTADDYPPAVDSLPRFGVLPIDFEAVTALDPDLVLATDQVNKPGDAATFEALGIPVFFFSYRDVDGMLKCLRTTGQLLGTPDRAQQVADSLSATLQALREKTASVAHRPRTLVLIGDETLYGFGRSSYIHDLVAAAGGQSLTRELETESPVLTDEFVLAQRPEVIIGAFGEDYDPARLLALHPSWDVVPAVRDERVYSLPPALLLRPGPRLVEGARRMARLLHPELFSDHDASAIPAASS